MVGSCLSWLGRQCIPAFVERTISWLKLKEPVQSGPELKRCVKALMECLFLLAGVLFCFTLFSVGYRFLAVDNKMEGMM